MSYYFSQDQTDTRTLANKIEQFHKWYDQYPENCLQIPTGCESFSNYEYCEQKGIQAFKKYPSWNGERTGKNLALHDCVDEKTITSGKSKILEIQPHYAHLKLQARDLLLSPEDIELRINRSCQVEGAFGVGKQKMQYTRFRRWPLNRVTVNFALTCLRPNIRNISASQLKIVCHFIGKDRRFST